MRIQEPLSRAPLTQRREYTYIGRDGICRTEQEQVLCELHMKVQVSHADSFSVVCIPEYLPELILGRLLTSGLISSADDVEEIRIDSSLKTADAILKEPLPAVNAPEPPAPIPWSPSQIFSLADRFSGGMPLHSQTFATHSCFLAREDRSFSNARISAVIMPSIKQSAMRCAAGSAWIMYSLLQRQGSRRHGPESDPGRHSCVCQQGFPHCRSRQSGPAVPSDPDLRGKAGPDEAVRGRSMDIASIRNAAISSGAFRFRSGASMSGSSSGRRSVATAQSPSLHTLFPELPLRITSIFG